MTKYNAHFNQNNRQGIVVACTSSHRCGKDYHPNGDTFEKYFYSIDLDNFKNPDFNLDIRGDLPLQLKNRFLLTFVEYLDHCAYNPSKKYLRYFEQSECEKGLKGFNNLLCLTKENGFILIKGCSRVKDCRESIYLKNLKYIESDDYETVLIPKNQNLTEKELLVQLALLPVELLLVVQKALNKNVFQLIYLDKFISYCDLAWDRIKTTREEILNIKTMQEKILNIKTMQEKILDMDIGRLNLQAPSFYRRVAKSTKLGFFDRQIDLNEKVNNQNGYNFPWPF